jgi:hypothetical protein
MSKFGGEEGINHSGVVSNGSASAMCERPTGFSVSVAAQCEISKAFSGLENTLLERTLERLDQETNTDAALWFSQQI